MPRLNAAPFPMLCGCSTTRRAGYWDARSARISREPSFDPSSTHSNSIGSGTSSTLATMVRRVALSLYPGMTTDNFIETPYSARTTEWTLVPGLFLTLPQKSVQDQSYVNAIRIPIRGGLSQRVLAVFSGIYDNTDRAPVIDRAGCYPASGEKFFHSEVNPYPLRSGARSAVARRVYAFATTWGGAGFGCTCAASVVSGCSAICRRPQV